MSFSNLGSYTIAAPQPNKPLPSLRFEEVFLGGDHGAQYVSAHPTPPYHDARLVMSEQKVMLTGDNTTLYGVTITNEGPLPGKFSFTGGGFI